jgi:ferritin-like metal-binding protein YciE
MPSITSLKDLLVDELKDLYSAEQQLVKALPKMSKASTHADLKDGFNSHLEETRGHVQRLEEAFSKLGIPAKAKTCKAMQGLIAERAEAIDLDATETLRDACLIGAAQRVEHYEIAAYGTARAFASTIGEDDVADLLQETLEEEAATDKKLTSVAEAVNQEAKRSGDESEEETSIKNKGKDRRR